MILDKQILITISNQGKYYISLGYQNIKQGVKIYVKIEDLPLNSNKKIKCSCNICDSIFYRQYQLLKKNSIYNGEYYYKCSRKLIGKLMNKELIIKKLKERTGINHPRWNPNKSQFKEYYMKVRKITEQTYKNNKDIINPDNLPRTLCGVDNGYQLDHIFPIKRGYILGINPKVIGSIDNLQMLSWQNNILKFTSLNTNTITFKEL